MKWSFRPRSRLGWWAFWLGMAVIGMVVVERLWPYLEHRLFTQPPFFSSRTFESVACLFAVMVFALVLAATAVAITAFRVGERSWMALVPFLAVLLQVLILAYQVLLFIYISVAADL